MKRKGFTLIELLAVIIILAVIALIATPIILGVIGNSKKGAFEATAYGISQAAKNTYVKMMYAGEETKEIVFSYVNGSESSNPEGYTLDYEGAKPLNGQVSLTANGKVALAIHDGKYCITKGYNDASVTTTEDSWADCDMPGAVVVDSSGANTPVLATGMTPIVWNGTAWVTASNTDDPYKQNWYDYSNQKWANAKTADGSMWVWIPRYIYKISTGWHTNTTGTINVQFSQGTNDNWNSAVIGALDTGTGSSASNNKWTNHPAFTFGTTELTGIWIAKFEATSVEAIANGYTADASCPVVGDNVTTKTIKIIPNAVSWRCISLSNIFTNIRNMETKAAYGWPTASTLKADGSFTTDTNNIDTHLIKNIEWGAIAYLSKSLYGKNTVEIWPNTASYYITGCSGDSANATAYASGCMFTYNTQTGGEASSTGNIYGVYDISGGSWEYVSAYINNANGALSNGSTITGALAKYKDTYSVGTTDSRSDNYTAAVNKKGDALYETSASAATASGTAWFGDYANMSYLTAPWFIRGSRFVGGSSAGAYIFYDAAGGVSANIGFRPVLAIGTGL